MLHKLLRSFRSAGYASDFDAYYRTLSRNGLPGGPTIDEARKDYRDLVRHEFPWR